MKFIDESDYGSYSGIYRIRNIESGLVYIGQTRQPFKKRFLHHQWKLREGTHDNKWLQASYNKHGDDAFVFEILCIISQFDALDYFEKEYISEARNSGNCCNLQDGGQPTSGPILSDETRKHIGECNRIHNLGKKASKETREKMSKSRLGKPRKKDDIDKMITTRVQKIKDGVKMKTMKLTPEDVVEIKLGLMNGVTYEELSSRYNISKSNINAIRSNRSWKYVHVDGWDEFIQSNIA